VGADRCALARIADLIRHRPLESDLAILGLDFKIAVILDPHPSSTLEFQPR
jgi:hypothetical protein